MSKQHKVNISKQVMTRIKNGQVKMRTRLNILARRLGLGSGVFLLGLVVIFILACLIYWFKANQDLLYISGPFRRIKLFWLSFPYLWLAGFIWLFVLFSWLLKKYDFTYKTPLLIVAVFLITSFGSLALFIQGQPFLTNYLRQQLPLVYKNQASKFGFVIGKVVEKNVDQLILETENQQQYLVQLDKQTRFARKQTVNIGDTVRAVGQIKNQTVKATVIMNLNDRARFFKITPRGQGQTIKLNQNKIKLIATGDIIPARSVNSTMVRKNDFTYPFLKTASLLNKADLVLINLEAPLINDCPVTDEGMVFCGDPRFIKGLKYANVSVANLANNHSGNYGNEGLDQTTKLLEQNGIKVTGLGKTAFIKKNGIKFAFLGFNDIEKNPDLQIALAEPKTMKKQIKQAKKQADFVIVSLHWGDEYTNKPNQRQRFLAHLAIDSGADLIIGNHPHWIQTTEKYKGKLINYALGNFIFDQMWSDETRQGNLGWYVIDKNQGLISTKFYPVLIENYSQPRFLTQF